MINGDLVRKIFYLHSFQDTKKLLIFLKRYRNIILTGGCFDILHYGHITFLKQAKKQGGSVVVFLESDRAVLEKKKRKPIHTQEQRAKLLAAITYVDAIIALPYLKQDSDYEKLTKIIRPRVIATTKGDVLLKNKEHQARLIGAAVKIVTPEIKGFSTSLITNYAAISGD